MSLKFQLSEETVRGLLNLATWKIELQSDLIEWEDELAARLETWKEKIAGDLMSALDKQNTEIAETKAAVAAIGVAVSEGFAVIVAKYAEVAAQLKNAITEAQMDAAQVEFDAVQASALAIAKSIKDQAEALGSAPAEPEAPAV